MVLSIKAKVVPDDFFMSKDEIIDIDLSKLMFKRHEQPDEKYYILFGPYNLLARVAKEIYDGVGTKEANEMFELI